MRTCQVTPQIRQVTLKSFTAIHAPKTKLIKTKTLKQYTLFGINGGGRGELLSKRGYSTLRAEPGSN